MNINRNMTDNQKIKLQFLAAKQKLFGDRRLLKDAYKFCIAYSILVEEYIIKTLVGFEKKFVIASGGSFSRRELSPYSDIDVIFIYPEIEGHDEEITRLVTLLWDCGIEVSHTVREYSDLEKFLKDDLHTFTQFFETRFIYGSEKIYDSWNKKLFLLLNDELRKKLIYEYIDDVSARHKKHGESPKVLEPNVKFTAGGLRDLHSVEWMYSLKNNLILAEQSEITQTEIFIKRLRKENFISAAASVRLLKSYKKILDVRNKLHLIHNRKVDRFEFADQEAIAESQLGGKDLWLTFMKDYFTATNIINRFANTMLKRFDELISNPLSEHLIMKLDDSFYLQGSIIGAYKNRKLEMPEMLRVFYYRGIHDSMFTRELRSNIIESVFDIEESQDWASDSSVFFREILKLPSNVGKTLSVMNELGVLSAYLPEFREVVGFFQPGVYHCYTTDEHTLIALNNLENLADKEDYLGSIFGTINRKDLLYLAVLFHDIAKPISISGHEIIGADIANSVMERLGYGQNEITLVQFLVRHHLTMEQIAFRRNINDPVTLNNFTSLIPSIEAIDMLYLLTYADLSAVSPVVWTNWKSELLYQLYIKTRSMMSDKISGEELLYADALDALSEGKFKDDENIKSHVESINDLSYIHNFSQQEINDHVEEIESGQSVSVFFKQEKDFTNITIITKDSPSLLSRLCGALSINDLNIHDAKIFTRKDGIAIDTFNVTDFRTNGVVEQSKFEKIKDSIELAIANELQISKEFSKVKSKWWRIESKLFKRKGKIKIEFEDHDKYTIIDIFSPDRLGLLYQITRKINECGLSIYFAKISTKSDDVVDSFYVLNSKGKKIPESDYELIGHELNQTIEEML